jgi:hypothetical protein
MTHNRALKALNPKNHGVEGGGGMHKHVDCGLAPCDTCLMKVV